MRRIHVGVVSYKDQRNLALRYRDPVTGKVCRSTVYRDPQSGEEIETGTDRKFAKKLAARWEADLNNGRDQGRYAIGWQAFRARYEAEVLPGLADQTGDKIRVTFGHLERALPKVAAGRLADLTPEALSKFQAELRDGKRSESTIGSYLAHLRATLAWACDQGMILAVPKIRRPQRAKKAGRTSSKGRPITAEEFDRLLAKVPEALAQSRRSKRATDRATREHQGSAPRLTHRTRTDNVPIEINPAVVESWRYYLKGLWLSGLRLEESLLLDWTRGDRPRVDLTGRRPMLRIPAECEKGHRDRLLPITPDFAEFLLQTPPAERRGPVFLPLTLAGNRMAPAKAGKIVTLIGESARVLVHTDPRTGKVKYASAHDLRRSFGNRWAKRVMPAVLQRLMRHESIETTMAFYVALDADELAEDLYRDHEKRVRGENGTVFGTVAPSGPSASNAMNGGNTCRNGG